MARLWTIILLLAACLGAASTHAAAPDSSANPALSNLNHIIVIFLENRSFDHYFGVLPYAPGSPYHAGRPCAAEDHACVDGLRCHADGAGALKCDDWNAHADGRKVYMVHADTRCIAPDLDHEWQGSHRDVNFAHPEQALAHPLMDGFVMQNDIMAPDTHRTGPAEGARAMTWYSQADLPFYYAAAERFAISDRYFSSVLGASDPNHAFHLAGSFFGHITDEEVGPPRPDGYKPLQGTIYDRLTAAHVDWAESYQDIPEGAAYLRFVSLNDPSQNDPHFIHHAQLLDTLAGKTGAKPLPSVVWVNAEIGYFDHGATTNNEHPSSDIQRGQAWVSHLLTVLRAGPYWKDSAVLITYDEGGGFFDHVPPPAAPQGGVRSPDGLRSRRLRRRLPPAGQRPARPRRRLPVRAQERHHLHRDPGPLPAVRPRQALSRRLPRLRPAGLPRAAAGDLALRQAGLRLPPPGRPHLHAGADRETVPHGRGWQDPAPDRARPARLGPGGHVRLPRRAQPGRRDAAGSAAAAGRLHAQDDRHAGGLEDRRTHPSPSCGRRKTKPAPATLSQKTKSTSSPARRCWR